MLEPPHITTLWTARVCAGFYLAALTVTLGTERRSKCGAHLWRILWSLAFASLAIHVACAFEFEHDWSHGAAFRHTAAQTESVTGINWGGGLYFNYLFLLWWGLDVATCWFDPVRVVHRGSRFRRTSDALCAFMMLNATVVFGPDWWKWVALIVLPAFAVLWWSGKTRRNEKQPRNAEVP